MQKYLLALVFALAGITSVTANDYPYITVGFDATDSGDETVSNVSTFEGSAPIRATFRFEAHDAEDWTLAYEWRFCHEGGTLDEPYMVRYEESPEVTFTQAGTDSIALYAVFTRDGSQPVEFRSQYWRDPTQAVPLTVMASESVLTFPNAFSPNGDGINDFFKPKTFESIVEFHATIYNRWGQKIYDWSDVRGDGWDGKFNGKDVKQGVYYVLVKAKGADGRVFEIKKDVNLLRGYTENETLSPTGN
ncbi:MAG: gliding motility-associated C-terminal domain-containing protein [Prevotellaceae bacterium]|nr:gliding motility-associated C-terminal domain-containing protein [Prevotellaceae bacterium]MDO4931707.1 gliding motility-associated C-terminal domain-containing protein [Prevotellaceae bacterium]